MTELQKLCIIVLLQLLLAKSKGEHFNLLQTIKTEVVTSMSSVATFNSQHTSWDSRNVIDNVATGSPNTCGCCAGTSGLEPPWLQIDLGKIYSIKEIQIVGRSDGSNKYQYENIYVFVSNSSMETINGTFVYKGNTTEINLFKLRQQPPKIFQFLIIRRFIPSYLVICEVKLYEASILDSIRDQVSTTQSRTYINDSTSFRPENAIDGKSNYDIDHCQCCSVIDKEPFSWWQIDLRNMYTINRIEIFGRSDLMYNGQLQGANVYAGNTSLETISNAGTLLYTVPTITNSTHFVHSLDEPVTAQFFIIRLQTNNLLTICEFYIYGKGPICDEGKFRQSCSQHCNCADGKPCDFWTGKCQTPGCLPGWKGVACNIACNHGHFGADCKYKCHCFDNASCAKDTGICSNDRCEAGWELSNCSKDGNLIDKIRNDIKTELSSADQNTDSTLAVDGLLGPDPDICHCCSITSNSQMSWWQLDLGKRYPLSSITIYGRNKEDSYKQLTGFNLILPNDSIGNRLTVYNESEYNTSENVHTISLNNVLARYIKIERPGVLTVCEVIAIEGHCKDGTFGDECSQYCQCADNRPCDQLHGYCQSPICKLGWTGESCNQSCPQNTFGEGCSKLCYCEDDTCSSDYGICPGKCKTGYRGAHCSIAYVVKDLPATEIEHHTSAVIIGGSVAGGIGVIVVLVVLFVCCHKHRTKHSKSQSEDDNYYKTINRNMTQHDDELYDTIGISEETRGQVYEGGNQTTSGL